MCPSQIDPTLPVFASPTTQSVRNNFQIAANEITTLQNQTANSPFLPLSGGRMQGPLYLFNDPTDAMMPATKGYVDASGGGGGGGGIPEAPADGLTYGRNSGAWHQVLPIEGGGLTGPLILAANASAPLGAVTKQQLDAISSSILPDAPNDGNAYGRQSQSWAEVLPLAGGDVTGSLGVNLPIPTSPAPYVPTFFAVSGTFAEVSINSYQTASGPTRTRLTAGGAALFGFNPSTNTFQLSLAPTGAAGSAISSWLPALTYDPAIGSAWMAGAAAIPSDSFQSVLSVQRLQAATLLTNLYIPQPGTTWKYLANGYGSVIYQDTSGRLSFSIFPSGSAGGNATPIANMVFDQSGNLTLANANAGLYASRIAINPINNYEWSLYLDGSGNHIENHRANWSNQWSSSTGTWTWNSPTTSPCMSLTGAGNLAVLGTLSINGATFFSNAAAGGLFYMVQSGTTRLINWTANYSLQFNMNNGNVSFFSDAGSPFWIDRVGNATFMGNITAANVSDERTKRNRKPYTRSLADLIRLNPESWEYNGDGGTTDDGSTRYGLTAQDAQPFIPECVYPTIEPAKDERYPDKPMLRLPDQLSLDPAPLIFAIINALKEIAARLDTLERNAV